MIKTTALKRLLQNLGIKRASPEALERIKELTEEYIKEIGSKAIKKAKYRGRKTIRAEDLEITDGGNK